MVSIGIGDAKDLAAQLAKWAEKHGYATAPDHAERLTIELKLVEQERDYLRTLLRESLTGKKDDTVTLAQIGEAVRTANQVQAQKKNWVGQPMPGPQGTGLGKILKGNPSMGSDEPYIDRTNP